MTFQWLMAALHIIALGIGTAAIAMRANAFAAVRQESDLKAVFRADTWWGLAARKLLSLPELGHERPVSSKDLKLGLPRPKLR